MILWRLIGVRTINKYQHHIFSKKTLLLGTDIKARQMLKKINDTVESRYNIVGFASEESKQGNR